MFITSTGGGILTIPITIVCAFIVLPIVPSHDPGLLWPAYTGILSGVLIFFIGRHWNSHEAPMPQKNSLIKTKKYKRVVHNEHRLYWIPMQHVGLIFIILGIVLVIVSKTQN